MSGGFPHGLRTSWVVKHLPGPLSSTATCNPSLVVRGVFRAMGLGVEAPPRIWSRYRGNQENPRKSAKILVFGKKTGNFDIWWRYRLDWVKPTPWRLQSTQTLFLTRNLIPRTFVQFPHDDRNPYWSKQGSCQIVGSVNGLCVSSILMSCTQNDKNTEYGIVP